MIVTVGSAFATDYSKYSTEELINLRGTMKDATDEEKEALRNEMQARIQNMSDEERQNFFEEIRSKRGSSQGFHKGSGRGMGRGSRW
jgi:hypothetical protein